MAVKASPQLEAYVGATGSGKGVSIDRRLSALKPARLLIWDPRNEYDKHARPFDNLGALVEAWVKAGPKPIKSRYVHAGRVPIDKAFGIVCALAFQAGDTVLLAEELSDVTKPSWAPDQWRRCITQGRHKGLTIIGATQRPALIDKTFLGNCTLVRTCMLGYDEDTKAMARELRCSPDLIAGLATEDLDGGGAVIRYVERIRRPPTLYAGEITIKSAGGVKEKRQIIGPNGQAGQGAT